MKDPNISWEEYAKNLESSTEIVAIPFDVFTRLPLSQQKNLLLCSMRPTITRQINYTPIAQKYDGHQFRSRLEARWAVFFNEMGVNYEYEKQVYTLSSKVRYLPDFFLPRYNLFIEIKGQTPTNEEEIKCRELFELTGCAVAICTGLPCWDTKTRASMWCWVESSENRVDPINVNFEFTNDNDGTLAFSFDFNFPELKEGIPCCEQDVFWPRFYGSQDRRYELDADRENWWAVAEAIEKAKHPHQYFI